MDAVVRLGASKPSLFLQKDPTLPMLICPPALETAGFDWLAPCFSLSSPFSAVHLYETFVKHRHATFHAGIL
jgi:hypothetical protein